MKACARPLVTLVLCCPCNNAIQQRCVPCYLCYLLRLVSHLPALMLIACSDAKVSESIKPSTNWQQQNRYRMPCNLPGKPAEKPISRSRPFSGFSGSASTVPGHVHACCYTNGARKYLTHCAPRRLLMPQRLSSGNACRSGSLTS